MEEWGSDDIRGFMGLVTGGGKAARKLGSRFDAERMKVLAFCRIPGEACLDTMELCLETGEPSDPPELGWRLPTELEVGGAA